jgi:hypothetical protein
MPTPGGIETRPIGLDNTAVLLTAQARGVDTALLTEILPRIEAAIINQTQPEPEEEDDDDT